MCAQAHFLWIPLETPQTTFITLFLGMMMLDSKLTSKAPQKANQTFSDGFRLRNNIDFEIKNLCLDLKRKEVQQYNPLHYAFGYELTSKPWLTYGERYE